MCIAQEKVVLQPPLKVTAGEFRINWIRNKAMIEVFSEEELELLDKLHVVLSSHDASKEFLFDVQMQLLLTCKIYRSKIIILI